MLRPNASPKRRPPHALHTILKHGSASLRKPEAHKRLRLKNDRVARESGGSRHLLCNRVGKECVQKENIGMPQATNYDAIVIGTSQGGRLLPIALAKAGRNVALIERDHVGGTCVNVGCTPTKTMVASARVAYLARRGADYGVHTGPISVDMQVVRTRKQGIVEGARLAFESRIEATQGLDLLMGEAHFIAPKTLEVHLKSGETQQITAPLIFIDTGDRPKQLTIKGVESVSVLNSTTIMELDTVPEHLFIIGGGYIALEFGQMFRRFGSQVTLIQHNLRLLMSEDEDVSDAIAKILREDGITVLTGTTPQQVEQRSFGRIQLTVRTPQANSSLPARICWRHPVASPTPKISHPKPPAYNWTRRGTSRSMGNWKRTFLASTRWVMSKVDRLSLMSLT